MEIPWSDLARLRVLRRLDELARRRCGVAPGVALATGRILVAEPDRARCGRLAVDAARGAGGVVPYACHEGRVELAAPIVVGESYEGCVFGSVNAGGDVALLGDLLDLYATEITDYIGERMPRVEAGGLRYSYDDIIGRSPSVMSLLRVLDKLIESESTVLIQGENGTGKELVARAIHFNSARRRAAFVVQNCSALNDNLLDSELFGHRKGAFTGAIVDKRGLFEAADRGTFFLDEIGDMSPQLQVKLLRVIQEGTFNAVGDAVTRRVDVRILAATNRDLRRMVERGEFREDLYYRVNVINIVCPPLRERRADIVPLIDHFLRRLDKGRWPAAKRLDERCLARLVAYAWPGNVRELENELERLWVLAGDVHVIGEELLSPRVREAPLAASSARAPSLGDTRAAVERSTIVEALRRHGGNKSRAAIELGISRRSLIRKAQKYGCA